MARAQTRCGGISYSEQGTGFPLVLLHASLCDRRDFDPIIPALAERHRVIGVDWPWHGQSDSPSPPLKAGAGVLADVLEGIGLPRRAGRATHAAIAGSRLELLGTGHMPFSSDPQAFLSLVMPFIERAEST